MEFSNLGCEVGRIWRVSGHPARDRATSGFDMGWLAVLRRLNETFAVLRD